MKPLCLVITFLSMCANLFALSAGQTQAQVVAEMGREPDSRMSMGTREIWTYKDEYKITFNKGIVTRIKKGPDTVYTTPTTDEAYQAPSRPITTTITEFVSDSAPSGGSSNPTGKQHMDTSDSFEMLDSLPSGRIMFYLMLPLASILAGYLAKSMFGV